MFRPSLPTDEALLMIQPRPSRLDAGIHMLFMNFDITAVWLDENLTVVDTQLCRRWHPAYLPSASAQYVIEAHPTHKDSFTIGDHVSFVPC